MQRVTGRSVKSHLPYFEKAAEVATHGTCYQAKCGAVIVKDGKILGSGYNGPPLGLESNRTCGRDHDYSRKPKYDKTCCIHAEWRAILEACKQHPQAIEGSTLYFMRVDNKENFTDAGEPYCTLCSRIALESGVGFFALWDDDGIDMYAAVEYDQVSYAYFAQVE